MILRRVIAHFKKQEWTAIALDFLIVVVGVFIGIQVSNWNQFAGDRRAETEYLRQLQGDLHNIQAEVDAQIEFERFHANLANEVFDLIRNDASDTRAQKINMGLNELIVRRTLRTQSPTFLDLQGSGKFELISDPALRAAIISYFYGTSRLEAALDKNNAFFIDQSFAAFVMGKGIPPRKWDNTLMKTPLPPSTVISSEFVAETTKGPLYNSGAAVLAAPPDAEIWEEFAPRLAWRGQIAANNEALAQKLSAATEELQAKLARRLERRAP
ncbi:hypothetical protein [Hyphococcus sp.]|uniref:hypothetical protein n=1 Tax=Hyphococcus sp. TaxID=2038636 RepID=UPI002080BDFA|nr:MAG: hypothetical protein DHS20C04_24140 [Marinicaulis sp.]